jgi:hypothetical protein
MWALGLALIVLVVAVVVGLVSATKPGSGAITFGHVQFDLHLAQASRVISTREPGFAFKADLTSTPGELKVPAEFDKWVGHRWEPVWRLHALVPSGSDTVLAVNYRQRFLETKGVEAPGYYRMIIFGRSGNRLAHGAFWFTRG